MTYGADGEIVVQDDDVIILHDVKRLHQRPLEMPMNGERDTARHRQRRHPDFRADASLEAGAPAIEFCADKYTDL